MRTFQTILGTCCRLESATRGTRWLTVLVLALSVAACGNNTTSNDTGTGTEGTDDVADDANVDGDADAQGGDIGDIVGKDLISGDADVSTPGDPCTTAKDCKGDAGGLCAAWACESNKCVVKISADGAACDDGSQCTGGDHCEGGQCKGNGAAVFEPLSADSTATNGCSICQCNEDGKTCTWASNLGKTCDDSNNCTSDDKCQAGKKCVGSPKVCDPTNDLCLLSICDPTNGQCTTKPDIQAEGKACTDNNACTDGEKCAGGKCDGGSPVICNDSNPCTTDSCDGKLSCVFTPTGTTATTCDDENACTTDDHCALNGKCTGTDAAAATPVSNCQVAKCDPTSGQITVVPAANGAPCDDKDVCTKGDVCNNQKCQGFLLTCNDGNACTDDACDPLKCSAGPNNTTVCGQCVATTLPDGAACEDGNKCTTADTCTGGVCSGLKDQCDDSNPCTTDSCLPGSGCIHVPAVTAIGCDDGDNCTIADKCAGAVCKGTVKDCKDTDPCTQDACDTAAPSASNCTHTKFEGPCDDGDNCTSNDVCSGGICAGGKVDCDDGNPCTNDLCDSIKKCVHTQVTPGVACDDGLACTKNDFCNGGKCVQLPADNQCQSCSSDAQCASLNDQDKCNGTIKCVDSYKGKVCDTDKATVVTCDATKDNACTKNTCDPDKGTCAIVFYNAGTKCTGDKCLDNAQCDGIGACKGVTKDCDDNNACTTDSCDSKVGCKHVAVGDGATCDDGSKCTPTDTCKAGKCVGDTNTCTCTLDSQCAPFDDGNLCNGTLTCQASNVAGVKLCQPDNKPIVCPALANTCQSNVCQPLDGTCKPFDKADNIACDDADLCTLGDTCQSGVCKGNIKANCNDSNSCTTDICDAVFGCDNPPTAAGGLCDDGNVCTTKDTCKSGNCVGAKLDCDDLNPCTVDLCDKATGCSHTVDDTLACDDGDPCTVPDHCSNALCVSTVLNCDDKNPCTIDTCDGNGGCKNVVYNGKDCDDGNACTISDTCVNDKCVGKVKDCNDNNTCTSDSCSAGTCINTVTQGAACDDGNSCTGPDLCSNQGQCSGVTLDCSTGTVCKTNLACSPVTGCVTVNNDGGLCDDGNACTGSNPDGTGDKCSGGGCSGIPITCDDQNVCTNDVCDQKLGCLITQNGCDDGNSCTVDTCDKVTGCQHETVNGGFCDDGDACTDKTTCDSGVCKGGQATVCDDKNDCTADSCDKATGCAHLPLADTATCNDGDICTTDHCLDGICHGDPKVCDDGNPCTIDSCNAISGCVSAPAAEGASCDDGDSCSVGEKCQSGQCGGGSLTGAGCNQCPSGLDSECIGDNNNLCDGRFRCKASTAYPNLHVCYFDPTIVSCDSTGDSACSHNQCNAATGKCELTQSVNGTKCEDGKGCTVGDSCYNGACVAGLLNDCSVAKDVCNDAKCVEDPNALQGFKCVSIPLDVTAPCDYDNNGCTQNDHCSAGTCVAGAPIDCSGVAKDCQTASCKSTGKESFTCQTATAVDGTACDDKQLCTVGDTCKAGKCTKGTGTYNCSSVTTFCSLGSCDATGNGGFGACVPTPQNENQPCDSDSNGCTQGDKCVAGFCVPGVAPDCTGSTTDCATGACKPTGASGFSCIGAPKPDKLPCEADQNGCTEGDSCSVGKCVPGATKDCNSLTSKDGCQIGTCKSTSNASNTCLTVPAQTGTVCNADDSGCTNGDACNNQGACVPGPAVDCNKLNSSCSTGSCLSTGTQTFVCQGTSKPDGTVCDADGNGCTENDKCTGGKCVAGTAHDCGTSSVQCIQKKCTSMAFDKYLCQDLSLADQTACDADGNGCTVGDACYGGICAAGLTETCASAFTQCNTAKCVASSKTSYTCQVTPQVSYPTLYPPVSCVSTGPNTCATGYSCTEIDAATHAGYCQPSAIVNCSDGNACTTGDACSNGTCVGGASSSCADNDICTTDSCDSKTGACVHTPIAGCGLCLNEDFTLVNGNMVVRSLTPSVVNWTQTNSTYVATWDGTTWKDPSTSTTQLVSRLLARKLFIQDNGMTNLDFDITLAGGDSSCTSVNFQVLVNDVQVKSMCNSAGNGVEHVTIDLSAWAGAPVDIVFQVEVGATKPTSTITATLDNVKVNGMCSTSCVGVDFEPRGSRFVTKAYVSPQSWIYTQTDATYAAFAAGTSGSHTGSGELAAVWAGTPTSGTAQVAKVTIPQVSVVAGNKLKFAVKSSFGDLTCGADDLAVRVNTSTGVNEVFKLCDSSAGWLTQSVDLTPYANSTVDIDFVVTTGANSKAKGTLELDDIAITGTCSYLCLSETFDAGGVSKWTTSVKPTGTAIKAWLASTTWFNSGTSSALAQFDQTVADGATTSLLGTESKDMDFLLPVMGASLSMQMNAFFGATPADCTVNAAVGVFWARIAPIYAGYVPPATLATLTADLTEPLNQVFCNSTSGGVKFTAPISPKAAFDINRPGFYLVKQPGVTSAKVYVDDVQVICQ